MRNKVTVVIVRGNHAEAMVQTGLKRLGVKVCRRKVVIKPNLIANRPYPVTTSPKTVEAIINCFKDENEVIIAEGSGFNDTFPIYHDQGYITLSKRLGVKLIDLNHDIFEVVKTPKATVLKEFEFPLTLKDSYLISVPVLKRHSITQVTLSLKNMLGATIGRDKGRFHKLGINESIVDINLYKKPDLAVIDGRLSLDSELGGREERFGVMIFSEDPVAADAVGTKILGLNPFTVHHLRLAQEAGLGTCDLKRVNVVELGE